MKNRPLFSFAFIACVLTSALCWSAPFDAQTMTAVAGDWVISEVRMNAHSTATSHYRRNDPRLVGRVFSFQDSAIRDDTPEDEVCPDSILVPIGMNLNDTLRHSLGGYGYPARPVGASDFEINQRAALSTSTFQIGCGATSWHSELGTDSIRGAWLAKIDAHHLLIRWHEGCLLPLTSVPKGAVPSPSFSCAAQKNVSETTICGSFQLSEFDRSISSAYRLLVAQARLDGQDVRELNADQTAWLKTRNECLSNEGCLIKSMRERLETIASKIAI